MKLCIECKYLKHNTWCVSPENGLSDVDGKPIAKFALVNRSKLDYVNGSMTTRCGPDAKFFSPKEVKVIKKPWWKFW